MQIGIDFFGGELLFLAHLKPDICVSLIKLLKVAFNELKVRLEIGIHFYNLLHVIVTQSQQVIYVKIILSPQVLVHLES